MGEIPAPFENELTPAEIEEIAKGKAEIKTSDKNELNAQAKVEKDFSKDKWPEIDPNKTDETLTKKKPIEVDPSNPIYPDNSTSAAAELPKETKEKKLGQFKLADGTIVTREIEE